MHGINSDARKHSFVFVALPIIKVNQPNCYSYLFG